VPIVFGKFVLMDINLTVGLEIIKLNSTSIFPAIRYKGFVDMSVMDFIGIDSFEGTKFTFYI